MTLSDAGSVFTKLTIGDGLVSQVPAFLISLAAGLLVTRSSYDSNLPYEFIQQLFSRPQALAVTGGFLFVLIFTNLPTIPLMLIGGSCMGISYMLTRQKREAGVAADTQAKAAAKRPPEEPHRRLSHDRPDGDRVGRRADLLGRSESRGGDLLEPDLQRVRQNIAAEMGIIMPKVRIRDHMRLEQNQYRIKLADMVVAGSTVEANGLLAMDSGLTTGKVRGVETREPAFNTPAIWIDAGQRSQAEIYGYTVIEPASVVATHLTETVRRHADELLTRDAAKHLIDQLKQTQPAAVDELIPGQMKLSPGSAVLACCRFCSASKVPIRQLSPILETLGDYAGRTKDPILLAEYAPPPFGPLDLHALSRQGKSAVRGGDARSGVGRPHSRAGIEHSERGLFVRMSPQAIEITAKLIATEVEKLTRANHQPIILVSPQIRAGLKQMTATHLPRLIVLSFNEITRDTQIESTAVVSDAVK